MSGYSANITGSDPFWYRRRTELQATFEQKKMATLFFTFSYPDNHLADLHRLMIGNKPQNKTERYKAVLKNPALVDWYFSYRLDQFLAIFFDDILDADWRWHRYEWQVRTSIHAHGAVRFKNDPGIVELTTLVYESKMIQAKYFPLNESDINKETEYLDLIERGQLAEIRINTYVDTLITALNPKTDLSQIPVVPDPHPCCIDICLLDPNQYDDDYLQIVNCCQRHICRVEGYCKSKKKNLINQCRFGFPRTLTDESKIIFKETKTRVLAEMELATNDPYMNPHIRLLEQEWRGNTDAQIILDSKSAEDYIAKYACKGMLIK
jgi:hypothetical protein